MRGERHQAPINATPVLVAQDQNQPNRGIPNHYPSLSDASWGVLLGRFRRG